jgi:hypothetical protein
MGEKVERLLQTIGDTLSTLPEIRRVPTDDGNFIEQITLPPICDRCERLAGVHGCELSRGSDGCMIFKLPEGDSR